MFVLRSTSGGYVRATPPEIGFEYVSDPSQALKFSSEAEALAYLTEEYPIRRIVPRLASGEEVLGPIIGYFTRESKTTLQFYVINVGDL